MLCQTWMKNACLLILGTALLVGLSACTDKKNNSPSSKEDAYRRVTESQYGADSSIPLPSGEVMLTVGGKIENTNDDSQILMDRAAIEAVGLVEYEVEDPFLGEKIVYRGVLVEDLLKLWQVDESATTLYVLALNDFEAEVPIKDIHQYPVLFALQANGEYMPISRRGPAMFVYPYHAYTLDKSIYNAYWVWQIKYIEVR